MLRTVASSLLKKYLGRYVEGLDQKIDIKFDGNLELNDLRLRNDSLDEWELPVVLQSGKFSINFSNKFV